MHHAFDPGSEIPAAELVSPDYAIAALTLRCSRVTYRTWSGHLLACKIWWVPLAVRPQDGLSWLLWERVPPCYPDVSSILPTADLEEVAVLVDGDVYRSTRHRYLDVPTHDRLPPGGWMAS